MLKVVHEELARAIARVKQDYERAATLNHPYLAEILDYGVLPSGVCFSAWVHQPGQTLFALPHALRVEQVAQLGAQVAMALAVLHSAGWVHRDVSPGNILWSSGGAARLIDFGFLAPAAEPTGLFAGTPQYAAPELLRGQSATPRSDLYSLGAVLYFLVTGEAPYPAHQPDALLRAKEGPLPLWPPAVLAEYPPGLLELIRALLAPQPAERPSGATEVCLRLLDWGTGEGLALGPGAFLPPAAWDAWVALQAAPGVWVWEGETACGRTRVLQEAFKRLRASGRPVVWLAGARDQEPYGALETLWRWAAARVPQVVEAFPRALARLVAALWPWAFPDLSPLDEPSRLARVLPELLRQLLVAVAEGQALAVLIDDWDDVDAASRDVLHAAMKAGWPGFHWLLSSRDPVPFAHALSLPGLPRHQSGGYLASLTPVRLPEAWADALWHMAGGRPGWMRQGLLHALNRPAQTQHLGLPDSMAGVLAGLWEPLRPVARHAMLLLAVCGGQCDWEEWRRVAVLLGSDWPLELEHLAGKQLVEQTDRGLSFGVGWWLDWISQHEPSLRLKRLAAEVARLLAPAAVSTAAVHRVAALYARSDDYRAQVHWAQQAARQAARLWAYETALEHAGYGLAAWAELGEPEGLRAEVRDLRVLQADALRVLSNVTAATEAYEGLLREKLPMALRGRLLTSLGKCHQLASEHPKALDTYGAAIELLEQGGTHAEHLRALTALGRSQFHTGDRASSQAVHQEVLRLARVHQLPAFEAEALSFLGTLAVEEPRTKAEGLEALRVALALRESLDDPFGKVDTHMLLGNAHLLLGQLPEARQHFEANRALAGELGYRSEEGLACLNLALCEMQAGHWSDAHQALLAARRLADETRYDFLAAFAAYALSVVAAHRADWALMSEALEQGRGLETKLQSPYVRQFGLVCEAERHLLLGAFEPARRAATLALAAMAETGGGEWRFKALQCQAEALILAGDLAEAEKVLLPLRDLAEGLDTLFSHAALARLEGWFAWQSHDEARARRAWEDVRDRAAEAGLDAWYLEAVLALMQVPEIADTVGLDIWQRLQALVGWLGSPLWSALVSAGAGNAHRTVGETLLAERLLRRAETLLTEVKSGLPGTTLRQQYLAHPQRALWLKLAAAPTPAEPVQFGRRLTMLLELARVLGNSRDPEGVLRLVHAHTLELTRAERCLILLSQAESPEWRVWPAEHLLPYSQSVAQKVFETRTSLCLVDTLDPGDWRPTQSVRDLDLRSVVAVPLAAGSTVHGVLYVDSRVSLGAFGADDVAMLEAIAAQASVALETTRLLLALRRQMDQQAAHIRLLAQKDTTISALRDYDRARQIAFEAESHDLRAPLASILVTAQGLQRGLEGPLNPAQIGMVEGLLLNTRLLMTRIDGILDVASLQAGKLSLRRVSLPLARVLREVLEALKPMAEAKALDLRWDDRGWDDLPPLWGDARRLSQVCQNLVDNAVKYTPTGYVQVTLLREGGDVCLVVEDSGPGLPPGRLKAPFQRYGARDPLQHGSGMGLWRVAALVREHGGQIAVVCPPAGGSRFTVRLPLDGSVTGH